MKKVSLILWFLMALATSGVLAQNAPVTTAGDVAATGSTVILPITVTDFTNIASCDMKLFFDPAIATVTTVTANPLITGDNTGFSYNISVPGAVNFGWFAALGGTVPDNTAIFYIHFLKVTNGSTPVTFSTIGYECEYTDGSANTLNDNPFESYYFSGEVAFQDFAPTTTVLSAYSCPGSNISIPIKVTNFNTIGAVSLSMNYDPDVLDFLSGNNTSGYPGLSVNSPFPGNIIIGGFSSSSTGATYAANSTLATLNFYYKGGSTTIDFYDDGESCEYTGPSNNYPILNDSPQSTYYINGSVGPNIQTNWIGLISDEWNNPGNWSCDVPGVNSDVIINDAPFDPVISTDVHINSVIINSGAILTVEPTASLTLGSDLSNNAGPTGLLIRSDASGAGSLLHKTANVPARVQRYIAKYNVIGDQMFHFISSPVEVMAIRTEFVTTTPTFAHDFYAFEETNNVWINTKNATGGWNTSFENNFAVGKGYLIAYPDNETKTFTGELNNYPVSSPLVLNCTNTAGTGSGWNLLGNPFPSSIDWNLVGKGDGMDDALYFYDNEEENYNYYLALPGAELGYLGNGTQYIPSMQGFMVHANTSTDKTISISNNARTIEGNDIYYKSDHTVPGSLSLSVSANGHTDEAFIHFNHQATTAFDGNYDAYKLRSYSEVVPALYTLSSEGFELAINGLPEISDNLVIPLYLDVATDGDFDLSANLEGLQGTRVFLEDTRLNKTQNLSENPVYHFSASASDQPERFKLTLGTVGIDDPASVPQAQIYAVAGSLYVYPADATSGITISSISGQKVKYFQANGSGLSVFNVASLPAGVYLVTVTGSHGVVSSKIIL